MASLAGPNARILSVEPQPDVFDRLTDAVRRGGTALEEKGTVTPDHPVWINFARAMAPLMAGVLARRGVDALVFRGESVRGLGIGAPVDFTFMPRRMEKSTDSRIG